MGRKVEDKSGSESPSKALRKMKALVKGAEKNKLDAKISEDYEEALFINKKLDASIRALNKAIELNPDTTGVIEPFSAHELVELYKMDPKYITTILELFPGEPSSETREMLRLADNLKDVSGL